MISALARLKEANRSWILEDHAQIVWRATKHCTAKEKPRASGNENQICGTHCTNEG